MSDGKRNSDVYEEINSKICEDFLNYDDESGQGKQLHTQSSKKDPEKPISTPGSEIKKKLNFDALNSLGEYNTESNLLSDIENKLVLDDEPSPSLKRSNALKLKHIASNAEDNTLINDCSQFHNGNFLNQIRNQNISCSSPSVRIKFSINEADQKKLVDSLSDNIERTYSEALKDFRLFKFSDDTASPALKLFSQAKNHNGSNQISQSYIESFSTQQITKTFYCSTPSSRINYSANKIDHISLFESILKEQKVRNFFKNRTNYYIKILQREMDFKKRLNSLLKESYSRILKLFIKNIKNAMNKEADEAPEKIITIINSVAVNQMIPANDEFEPENKDEIEEKDFKQESTIKQIPSSNKKSSSKLVVSFADLNEINEVREEEKKIEGSHNNEEGSEDGSEVEFYSEEENDNVDNEFNSANKINRYVKSATLKSGRENINITLELEKENQAESDEANLKITGMSVIKENKAGNEFEDAKLQSKKKKEIDLPMICEKLEKRNPEDVDRFKVKKYVDDIFSTIKNKKDHKNLKENTINNDFRFYDSSRPENSNIFPINNNVIEKNPNQIKIIDDMPFKNLMFEGHALNLLEIVKSENYLFNESSNLQRLNLRHLSDINYFGDFNNIINLNADKPLKKLGKISEIQINLPLSNSINNISLTESAVSKRIVKQSDHTSSEILEFCEVRRKTLKELENKINTKNELINNLNFHWEEAEYEKNSIMKSSNLNNNFTYLSNLSLDTSNADSDFSYLFDFIIHNYFEQFHVYELIKEAYDSSTLLLKGNSIRDKISKDMEDFKGKFNTVRSKFNDRNNPIVFKELITQIGEFLLEIHSEFKKTRDILTSKNNKEKLAAYSLRLILTKHQNRTLYEMKKISSLTEIISKDSKDLISGIEKAKDNKILISSKSLKISEKRKDFEKTLKIISDETNETNNSILKSKRYLDKIAFCDLLLSMVNNEYFQNENASIRIENLKNFMTDRNLSSSMFCGHIFKIFDLYLSKVALKNIKELKNIKVLKLKKHNESKIKLKQIQIFIDTRNQEITSLEANIENCKNKQNEIQTNFKFSYSSFFAFAKIVLILAILLTFAKIIRDKLFSI